MFDGTKVKLWADNSVSAKREWRSWEDHLKTTYTVVVNNDGQVIAFTAKGSFNQFSSPECQRYDDVPLLFE